ncbi:MAG: hypothetical protein MO846_10255 [Candidatus Devosia symbiotica]|nr:hypothetical protein [Candidatus Devosia symbiotica]
MADDTSDRDVVSAAITADISADWSVSVDIPVAAQARPSSPRNPRQHFMR